MTTLWRGPSVRGGVAAGIALLIGCGGGGTPATPDAPGGKAPRAFATFAPPTPGAGGAWAEVPYPSDLYLDSTGHLALTTLPIGPDAQPASVASLQHGLTSLDGAGVRSNVYFPVKGPVAPASIAGAARLIDLDASTVGHLVEVPSDVILRADIESVVVAPKLGTVLRAHHHYGAYLTSAATDDAGTPIAIASKFATALDPAGATTDAGVVAARQSLAPLLAVLPADVKSTLVSATVFVTANEAARTKAMRDVVAANTPTITITSVYGPGETGSTGLQALVGDGTPDGVQGTGLDNITPQPHNHVALIIHGTITLPNFLSTDFLVDGYPTFVGGVPQIKSTQAVPFTLTLPRQASWTNLPVAIYVTGLGRPRIDLLTQANTAARQGVAMLGIDTRYCASRGTAPVDAGNELLGTAVPDGFADNNGLLAAIGLFHFNDSGGIAGYDPQAMGENLRQGAIEITALVEYIADGDVGPLTTAISGLTGVPHTISFRDDVGIITESLGGLMVGTALAVEPRLGVAYISDPASGMPYPAMMHSPNYSAQFLSVVTVPYGIDPRVKLFDPVQDARIDPIVMFFDNVVERGDSAAYAPDVADGNLRGDAGPDLVVAADWGDVWVSNDTQEIFAAALKLPYTPFAAAPTKPAQAVRFATLPEVALPVTGNRGAGQRTGAYVVFNPAGHAALRRIAEERNYDGNYPPFTPVDPATPIPDTQAVQIQALWGALFGAHFAGTVPTIADPYAN
jgi:hypothetical protein